MRTTAVVAVLALSIGCSKKQADKPPEPAPVVAADAAAAPPPPPAVVDAAAPAPAVDAAAAVTEPPPAAAKAICCESTGDATHDTLEFGEKSCKDDLDGDVVEMKDCDVDGDMPIIAAGQTITIAAPGQYVAWKGDDGGNLVACDIRLDAKTATVKCKGGGDKWKKTGKAAVAGAPITFTANADGSATLANGTTSWHLAAEFRYGDVAMKEAK